MATEKTAQGQTGKKEDAKPDMKPGAKPESKPGAKPASKPVPKPTAEPDTAPADADGAHAAGAPDIARLKRAAKGGDTVAMWDLAYQLLMGKYVAKDPEGAAEWFQKAADGGNADAAFEYGVALENGSFVDKDLDAAIRWFTKAKELGDAKADGELSKITRRQNAAKRARERREVRKAAGEHDGVRDIVLDHVSERFGDKVVLDDISLTIEGEELVAVVGCSGGGKSTLINIIRGVLKPSAGTATFSGQFGFVPQKNLVHESLTVRQQLSFYAKSVKKLPKAEREEAIERVIDELDLGKSKDTVISRCSGGEIRRVSVACELLAHPDGLLLDEPTSGLDPGDSGDLIDVLHDLVHEKDMTIVVINHDYENIKLFDKIVFLAKGKICFYGTPKGLFDFFDTTSSRKIYDMMSANPEPFIRRFADWQKSNPSVKGGIR